MSRIISILGSTGSIGRQTLGRGRASWGLPVAALTAHRSVERMEEQVRRFHPRLAVLHRRGRGPGSGRPPGGHGDPCPGGRQRLLEEAADPAGGGHGGHRRGGHGGASAHPGRHSRGKAHRPGQQGDAGVRRGAGDGGGGAHAARRSCRWTRSTPPFSSASRAAGTGERSGG